MKISETAKKNHDELFVNHKSTLEMTDPEFIAIFDNFTFDEVLSYGNLDKKIRIMMILASLITQQTLSEYKIILNAALNIGITPIEIKEIIYQAVPYCGIAKVFDFLHITNEIFEEHGIKLPLKDQSTTNNENRFEKGLSVQKEIFGDTIDNMYEKAPKNQVHIQEYLSGNCFGDYYTRKGLDIKTRELITFSILLSLGGCESQLKGHIQGNINMGNNKEILLTVITQILPFIGYPRALNAIQCLNEIIP